MLAQFQSWFQKMRGFSEKSPRQIPWIPGEFDGETLTMGEPGAKQVKVRVGGIREVGIRTTEGGPFVEDVYWLIDRGPEELWIPQYSPVFTALMEHFESWKGFDWPPFMEAMTCTDDRYFLCWERTPAST